MEIFYTKLINDPSLEFYCRAENNLNDSSPHGRNLSNPSPTYVTGRYGKAAHLASLSASNTSFSMNVQSPFAFGLFRKELTLPNPVNSGICIADSAHQARVFMGYTNYDGAGAYKIVLTYNAVGVNDQDNFYVVTLDITKIHSFIANFDGTNLVGYIDGIQVMTAVPSLVNGNAGSDSGIYLCQNGDYPYNNGSNRDAGQPNIDADEIFAFSRALTLSEIALITHDPTISQLI